MPVDYDAIGGNQFLRLSGDLVIPSKTVAEITRAGVDGRAFRETGARGPNFQMRGIADVGSALAAASAADAYAAAVLTVVSITKSGATRAGFLVLDARVIERKAVIKSVGGLQAGAGLYLVESLWELCYAGV